MPDNLKRTFPPDTDNEPEYVAENSNVIEEDPEWVKKLAKNLYFEPKESYGDEDQNDLMELIDTINKE